MNTLSLFTLTVLVLVASSNASGHSARWYCKQDTEDFQERHRFLLERMTTSPNDILWQQNMTIMTINDIREGTYTDLVKVVYWQRNWYDEENCRFVTDQAWPFPGMWRMSRVYSEVARPRFFNRNDNPEYEVVFDPDYLLYDLRAVTYLDFRSSVITPDTMFNIAVDPLSGLNAFDEVIRTIRPHEHAYYSNNYAPISLYTLPDWVWFHSHAVMDPAAVPSDVTAAFSALDAGTLSTINDPLATLEGATWPIQAYVIPTARRDAPASPDHADLLSKLTPLGRYSADHYDELKARAEQLD